VCNVSSDIKLVIICDKLLRYPVVSPRIRRQEILDCCVVADWLECGRHAWRRISRRLKCTAAVCHTGSCTAYTVHWSTSVA